MARYYRRRRKYARRRTVVPKRFSVETTLVAVEWTADELDQQVTKPYYMVPRTNIQGIRKVKNMSLEFCMRTGETMTFGWALVYWPGYWRDTAGEPLYSPVLATPSLAPSSLYEPNHMLIMQGIFNTADAKSFRRFTSLARNLNSEDTVVLLVRCYANNELESASAAVTLRYAIAY